MHSIIHSFVHLSIPYTTSINSIFQSKISYPPHICTSYAHPFFDCNISQFWNFVFSCALLQSVSQPAIRASNCCYPPTIIVVAAANSIKFPKFLFHSIIRCAIVIHRGCAVPCVEEDILPSHHERGNERAWMYSRVRTTDTRVMDKFNRDRH